MVNRPVLPLYYFFSVSLSLLLKAKMIEWGNVGESMIFLSSCSSINYLMRGGGG